MNMPDLKYQTDSFAGPINIDQVAAFETWLGRCGFARIKFYKPYLDHLTMFNGGRPSRRYFQTVEGTRHVVTRFLNFGNQNHRLAQYNVEATWSAHSDRLGKCLMPFAELFAGDLLCFDYSQAVDVPGVVVWFHERSKKDHPYVEKVANSFEEFLDLLADTPKER